MIIIEKQFNKEYHCCNNGQKLNKLWIINYLNKKKNDKDDFV